MRAIVQFQVSDNIPPFLGFGDAEVHVGVCDDNVWIGEPAFQSGILPGNSGVLQSRGVVEAGNACGFSAVDAGEPGTFAVGVERVAAGAALFEDELAACGVAGRSQRRFAYWAVISKLREGMDVFG